ncbi:MAG: efflux RND transporter permease subunit, partial [Candidatus Theseobacter exili]|nr:efflux RND transporter permease subunit [Candidatus Theseobacter exili]
PIQVANAVIDSLKIFETELPPGVSVSILRDMSKIYRQRAHLLLKNGLIGLTLVLLLLGFFLETRLAFWVMMGIPISFLGGLIFLPLFGVSINMITMFAFVIALGIVVDDAIIVGENVYEYHQRGEPFLKAAVLGAREVAMPVTFSILTNIVTFLPLFFVPGFVGKIWRVIPAVVVTVFVVSLGECLFILPAHLGHGNRKRFGIFEWIHTRQQKFSHWFVKAIRNYYGPLLSRILHHRYLTIAIAVAILTITIGLVKSKRMGMVLMPKVESDYSMVTAVLPYGTPIDKTKSVMKKLISAANEVGKKNGKDKLIKGIFSHIGKSYRGISGGHVVEVRTFLEDPKVRPISTRLFTQLWRKKTGTITGLETLLFESDRGGPGSGVSLTVELSHKNSDILAKAGSELAKKLENFSIVKDIDDGFTPGKFQFDFQIRPEGMALGLTSRDIAMQVRNAFYGAEALRQQRGRNEIKVKVRLPKNERISEYDINEFLIRTPAGTDIPIAETASITKGRAYTSIERRNGKRTITVSANVTPPKETNKILDNIKNTALPELQQKYPGLSFGFEGKQAHLSEALNSLFIGFAIAIFAIYALLAIPFKSYIQPLIIMVSIPFGIVGAVIGHIIMGYSLSLISMMGIVALSGVVVNDSLILIDFANRKHRDGKSRRQAIHEAGIRRFRPILLTTITTFGGLAPMIFETSRQARFMVPMAISLGFGILFATLITLALVPSLYMVVEDVAKIKNFLLRKNSL